MRQIIAGIAVIVAAFTMVGCGSNETEPISKDDAFIQVVRDGATAAEGVDDDTLIELAKTFCSAMDSGADVYEIMDVVVMSDVDPQLAGTVWGAGTMAYCPQHESSLPN